MNIAIIGAGIAGVSLARLLAELPDVRVEVFDKGRGIGGRLSTRYSDTHEFDHGASFFTARTQAFREFLAPYLRANVLREWEPRVTTLSPGGKPYDRIWYEPHYVALPRMNGLCKAIAGDVDVRPGVELTAVEPYEDGWLLRSRDSTWGPWDWVVSTAPPEQTRRLFPDAVGSAFDGVAFDPCFALMLDCSDPLPAWDAAVVKDSPVSWLAFTDRKPGRRCQPSLVLQATGDWSRRHFDADRSEAGDRLLAALGELVTIGVDRATLHRWRYARVTEPLGADFWIDTELALAACGDWCRGDRVEDAFVSAWRLATWFGNR